MNLHGSGMDRRQGESLRKKIRDLAGAEPQEPAFAPLRKNPGAAQILDAARRAGVTDEFSGLPAAEWLLDVQKHGGLDVLIARCFDDDPYSAADEAVLRESPDRVAAGLRLAAKACGAKKTLAAASCRAEARRFSAAVPDQPAAAAGRRFPASLFLLREQTRGGLRAAFFGAQACAALADAAAGIPQTCTVVTAAGEGFRVPGNYRVRVGTPAKELLRAAGLGPDARLVAVGSVLTGEVLADDAAPVGFSARCFTALRKAPSAAAHPCVRCGRCESACPVGVVPWLIHRELESGSPNPMLFFHAGECVNCRACSFVCPSGIALAEEVRRAATMKEGEEI